MTDFILELQTAANALLKNYKSIFSESQDKKETYLTFILEFGRLRDEILPKRELSKDEFHQINRLVAKINNSASQLAKD